MYLLFRIWYQVVSIKYQDRSISFRKLFKTS